MSVMRTKEKVSIRQLADSNTLPKAYFLTLLFLPFAKSNCYNDFLSMNITVNNSNHLIDESMTIDRLIEQLNIDSKGIAIAVNLTVVSKENWNKTALKENDNITIIKATQGG